MENLSKPIGQPFKNLLTIVTKQVCTVDQLGMVLNQQHGQRPEGHAQSSSSNPGVRPAEDVAMSSELQESSAHVEPSTVEQSSTPVQVSSDIPVTVHVTPHVESAGVTIAGVEVLPTSSIAVLRAACKYLNISQSGSKRKLWSKITAHLDKLKILEEVEIAQSSSRDVTRDPIPVQTAEKPEDEEEIKRHQLTHTHTICCMV